MPIFRPIDQAGPIQRGGITQRLTLASALATHFRRDLDKGHLFRVEVSTHRTDWVVTNDPTQHSTEATQEACGFRWKIEQLHREGKQAHGTGTLPVS